MTYLPIFLLQYQNYQVMKSCSLCLSNCCFILCPLKPKRRNIAHDRITPVDTPRITYI